MANHVAPPGWPHEVRPPDAPDWERTAVNWLLDLCPPEYRGYPALRRHVVVLARFAVLHVEACHAAVKRGLSEARPGGGEGGGGGGAGGAARRAQPRRHRRGGRDLAGRGGAAHRRASRRG